MRYSRALSLCYRSEVGLGPHSALGSLGCPEVSALPAPSTARPLLQVSAECTPVAQDSTDRTCPRELSGSPGVGKEGQVTAASHANPDGGKGSAPLWEASVILFLQKPCEVPMASGDFWHPSRADAGTLTPYIQACGCKGESAGSGVHHPVCHQICTRESLGVEGLRD